MNVLQHQRPVPAIHKTGTDRGLHFSKRQHTLYVAGAAAGAAAAASAARDIIRVLVVCTTATAD